MLKFFLLFCLGFLPDAVSDTGTLEVSIVGYEHECTNDANCKKTGFVLGTFVDRTAPKEGRCTHVTVSQCDQDEDCSQSTSWHETCSLFGYPCKMSACGNSSQTQQQCSCSTENPTMIWFTANPKMEYRLNAKVMEHNQEIGQVVSNVFNHVEKPGGQEYSRRKFRNGSNQLRFDLELVTASVLLATHLVKLIYI